MELAFQSFAFILFLVTGFAAWNERNDGCRSIAFLAISAICLLFFVASFGVD